MTDLNNITLQGRLTKDPEYREFQGGTGMAIFTLAVNDSRKGQDGHYEKYSHFFDCKILGKKASSFCQWFSKGDQTLISGKLTQEKWTDKASGANRSKVVVIGWSWHFCGAAGNKEKKESHQGGFDDPPPPQQQPHDPNTPPDDCPF